MRLVGGAVVLCVCVGAAGCSAQVPLGGVVDGGGESATAIASEAGGEAMPAGPDGEAGAADVAMEAVAEGSADATTDQTAAEASADVATDQTVTETGGDDATIDQTTGDDASDAGSDAGAADGEAGQDTGTDAGTFTITAGKVCTPDGWCWEHPLPQGNWLQSVWGTAKDNVWAVGPVGTLLHFDGHAWSGTILGPTDQWTPLDGGSVAVTSWVLKSVSGSAATDVWAVGANRTLHFDGSVWSSQPTGEASIGLTAVGSAGPSNAWAVGNVAPNTGVILHWDGTAWSRVVTGIDLTNIDMEGLFVQNQNDVWACGRGNTGTNYDSGLVLHYDGTAWTVSERSTTRQQSIWSAYSGPYNGHVWVGGQNGIMGTIDHFDGGSWSLVSEPVPSFTAISGSSYPLGVWAVGYNTLWQTTDGNDWSNVPMGLGNTLTGIWMGSNTLGWAVGASGSMRYFDGVSWTPQNILSTGLSGVWGSATDDVWLVGEVGGWVNGPAATGALLHWDGAGVSLADTPATGPLEGVWGSGAADVWVVGQSGYIGHRTTSLAAVQSPTTANLHGISGTGANDVWAVGDGATIVHKGTSGWATSPAPGGTTANLHGVFATSSTDAWAVGDSGTVLRWNGTQWTTVSVQSTEAFHAVWAASGSDVWLGGDSGVLHWDGSGWTRPASYPTAGAGVYALTGTSSTDVWAAGNSAWHWDGSAWSPSNAGYSSTYYLYGVGAWSLGGESWIVGQDGMAVHRGGGRADAGTAEAGASTARCAAAGSDLFVDPVYGSDTEGVGSQSLSNGTAAADCAFRTITRALHALPSTPAPGTRIVIQGPTTVLAASETFPIILPANTVLTSQGGPVTIEVPYQPPACPMGNGASTAAAFCLANPASGIQGGSGATITIGHGSPNYQGNDDGVQVFPGSDDSTFLENVTLQNFCIDGVSVFNRARVTIRQGVSAIGNLTNGIGAGNGGHVTIDVPAGQATTSFSGNSHYGIVGDNIEIHGAPGSVPGTGTVIVHDNRNTIDCDSPNYNGPYAGVYIPSGASISGGVVRHGTGVSSIDGLVSYGNNDGMLTEGASNVKLRNSVLLDGVGVFIQPTTAATTDGGVHINDLSRIDLGTTNVLPEGGIDYGRNTFLPPTDGGPNLLATGICLYLDPDSGTLNAAGNVFSGGRDCSGASPGSLSVSSKCMGDLGIWTYLDGGFADGPTDDAGRFAGNYINAANCTQ